MSDRLHGLGIGGFVCLIVALFAHGSQMCAADVPSSPGGDVGSVEYTWHDQSRDRDVPVKIYYPKAGVGAVPVIIFSHGLGGSREGYQYLGEYWAAHGFVSVHLQHLGSDSAVWNALGAQSVNDIAKQNATPKNAVDRFKDVSFAIDQLQKLNADEAWPLHGRLNLKKIGMAGHSFGAGTTMGIAGQVGIVRGQEFSFADPRITAAIAMSPSPPPIRDTYDAAYAKFKLPLFILTGTKDVDLIGKTNPADRRAGFDHITHAPVYLLTFDGGDHFLFSAKRPRPAHPTDELFHRLIQEGTTAFWNAYLLDDSKALEWLKGGDYAKEIGTSGVFETKNPSQ